MSPSRHSSGMDRAPGFLDASVRLSEANGCPSNLRLPSWSAQNLRIRLQGQRQVRMRLPHCPLQFRHRLAQVLRRLTRAPRHLQPARDRSPQRRSFRPLLVSMGSASAPSAFTSPSPPWPEPLSAVSLVASAAPSSGPACWAASSDFRASWLAPEDLRIADQSCATSYSAPRPWVPTALITASSPPPDPRHNQISTIQSAYSC